MNLQAEAVAKLNTKPKAKPKAEKKAKKADPKTQAAAQAQPSTSVNTVTFAPLTLDHAPAWSELLALSFNRTPEEAAQILNWLHDGYRVTGWGAWDQERLVAQYAVLRRDVLIDGQCVEAGLSLNMSVHPAYRGRGLVKQVSQPVYEALRSEGAAFGVGFSNAEGVKVDRHSKSYGYHVVGKLVSSVVYLASCRRAAALKLTDTLPQTGWDFGATQGMTQFEASAQTVYHRYAQHPFRNYRYGVWQEGKQVQGIVVYRPLRDKRGVALLAAYGHDLPELLARWSGAVCAEGVRIVHTLTTPNARLRAALGQVGVGITMPITRSPYFLTVKPLQGTPPLDFARWDCMGGEIL